MRMRKLIAALLASTALGVLPAEAQLMVPLGVSTGGGGYSPPPNLTCPYTGYPADGCAGVPAWSSNINPGFFNGVGGTLAAQSGQPAYAVRPPWNVAGVDYATGAAAPGTLADPAGAGVLPAGCAYHAQSGNLISYITCSVAGDLTLAGLNLSAIGGHACTMIDLWDSTIGGTRVNIQNVYAKWNSTNCGSQAICNNSACSPINGGSSGNGGTYAVNIIGDTFDWTWTQGDTTYGNPPINIQNIGDNTIEYDYFLNLQCRMAAMGIPSTVNNPNNSYTRKFNYFWGFDWTCDGTHVETENISSGYNGIVTVAAWNNDFNTVQIAYNHGQSWAALWGDVLQPGNYGTIANVTFNNNTEVANTSTYPNTSITRLMMLGQAQYGSLQITNNYLDRFAGGVNIGCSSGPNHNNPSDSSGGSILPVTAGYPTISGNRDLITGNVKQSDQIWNLYNCQYYGAQFVNGVSAGGNGTAVSSLTLSYSPTAGNLICLMSLDKSATFPTLTDNQGGSYPVLQSTATPTSEGYYAQMACKPSVAAGVTTFTASYPSAQTWTALYLYEISGANAIDGGAAAMTTLGAAGTFSSGSWTTTTGQLLLGYVHASSATLNFQDYNWTLSNTGGSNDKQVVANVSPQNVSIFADANGATTALAIGVAVH